MRSFVLATLAFAAAAIARPTSAVEGDALLGRSYPVLSKRDFDAEMYKRDPAYAEAADLIKRQIAKAQRAEGLTARDLQRHSLARRALGDTSCGKGPKARSSICTSYVAKNNVQLPSNGYANCNQNTGFCWIKCQNGYTLSGGVCVKNVGNCTPAVLATCGPRPRNGIWTCPYKKPCTLFCLYGQVAKGGKCYNTKFDKDNCGSPGRGCAASYNGVGAISCWNGRCSIDCPSGTSTKYTSKGQYYCA